MIMAHDIEAYIDRRIFELHAAQLATVDPMKRFEQCIGLNEMHRLAAWIEVKREDEADLAP
jgi:hypothetical protein